MLFSHTEQIFRMGDSETKYLIFRYGRFSEIPINLYTGIKVLFFGSIKPLV